MANLQYPISQSSLIDGVVYVITNKINGKQYVGQTTTTVAKRWRGHLREAKRGKTYPIHQAIRKYGADGFTVSEIARVGSLDQLNALESFCIMAYDTIKPNGYNLDAGGKARGVVHPETRAKMSAAKIGKSTWNLGKPCSDETKAKISAANKGRANVLLRGRILTEETKRRISDSKKGKPAPNLGKRHSLEAREKMSLAKKGRPGTPYTEERRSKKALQYRGSDGRFAKTPDG